MATSTEFNPKKTHAYTKAVHGRRWYEISHFAELGGVWHVWLRAAYGFPSGFVPVAEVTEWEFAENW